MTSLRYNGVNQPVVAKGVCHSLSQVNVVLVLFNFPFRVLSRKVDQYIHPHQQNEIKTILVWNGSNRKEIRVFGMGNNSFINHNCTYTRCQITDNRSLRPLSYYDAIIVVFNDEFTAPDQLKMPEFGSKRSERQRLVFFTQESPPALKPYYNMTQLAHFFNWTMTYRTDADIPLLYGRIIPKETAPRTAEDTNRRREIFRNRMSPKSWRNKTKTAAWMVSHCNTHSQREKYVKELSKYIDVDTYGQCGNFSCARDILHHSDPQCYDMLESTYKFYLSFENSLCTDYVTEKIFKIMGQDIVPVVYGGADYTKHAPPHSYIDARTFKPKELAAYLKLLEANDTLYNDYFWWKEYYDVEFSVGDMSRHGFCDLCQQLHEQQDWEFQSYQELTSQWDDRNACKTVDSNWIS
ncbi:putative Alpha--fucosyltransferase C [Daphnia magna]|uniref:Fucosyltransferase n=1 Tax=Daphnia magna TaxID=35525 RepID=A0A164ZU34_9CRUS|nr:putative Alpha--fucosyltransferase C [Daphnia magna]